MFKRCKIYIFFILIENLQKVYTRLAIRRNLGEWTRIVLTFQFYKRKDLFDTTCYGFGTMLVTKYKVKKWRHSVNYTSI